MTNNSCILFVVLSDGNQSPWFIGDYSSSYYFGVAKRPLLWSRSSYDISSYDVMVHLSGDGSYIYPIHASVSNGVACMYFLYGRGVMHR